jgi:hypothetical protein
MVISHPRQFGRESARPVLFNDASSFRSLTVLIAAATVTLVVMLPKWTKRMPDTFQVQDDHLQVLYPIARRIDFVMNSVTGRTLYYVTSEGYSRQAYLIGLVASLLLATRFGMLFCRSSSLPVILQNRAVAISDYSCAPLALTPLAAACFLGIVMRYGWNHLRLFGMVMALAPATIVLLLWWINGVILLKSASRCSWFRAGLCFCTSPVVFATLLPLLILTTAWIAGFVKVVSLSLYSP